MLKTFDDYLKDPRIKDEPMGLRITHAMRFKVQDETEGMTASERTAYYNEGARSHTAPDTLALPTSEQ